MQQIQTIKIHNSIEYVSVPWFLECIEVYNFVSYFTMLHL